MGAGGRSAASKRRLRHQQQPLVRTLNMQNKNEMQRGDFLSVWINLLREREGVEALKRNICSVVLILSRSHCPPLPLPHPHPHRRLKQCGQLKQEDITQLLLRISWLKCSRSFYLGGKQPSPLHKGARSLAASQPPSLHLDAALFCAVSTSACNLHFPRGSNRNISIISRSFIARSPHWHPLNTVTSRAQWKAQQPSVSTECSTKPAARKSTHYIN